MVIQTSFYTNQTYANFDGKHANIEMFENNNGDKKHILRKNLTAKQFLKKNDGIVDSLFLTRKRFPKKWRLNNGKKKSNKRKYKR